MKTRNLIILLAGATLLVAGCNKQNPFGGNYSRKPGDPVVFGVGSKNMETRTVYGEVNSTTHIQAINWVAGDKIRVYSPEAKRNAWAQSEQWADYLVNPITGSLNKGTLSNVQPVGLSWGENGTYHFYSVYPAPSADEEAVPANGTAGKFNLTIPATQLVTDEMEYAFMTAAAEVTTSDSDNAVELDFNPAFTAFEFIMSSDSDVTLKTFSLKTTGDALAGNFNVTYTGTTAAYSCTGTGKTITVSNLNDAQIGPGKDPLSFKVFCMPRSLSNLSITFTFLRAGATTPETRTLKLNYANGSPVTFDARLKHNITATMQADWTFRYITLEGEALAWTAETVDAGDTDECVEATQFVIVGANNVYDRHDDAEAYRPLRQTWIFEPDTENGGYKEVELSFIVLSPVEGTWEIVPSGDYVNEYEITGALTGTVAARDAGTTKVSLTIVPKSSVAADHPLYFKTFVTKGGVTYSMDSETQLFDTRGFHKFQINEPSL